MRYFQSRIFPWQLCFQCLVLLSISFAISACGYAKQDLDVFLRNYNLSLKPTIDSFRVCVDFACKTTQELSIPPHSFGKIESLFQKHNATQKQERANIANAIAQLEQHVGNITGTFVDSPKNGWENGSHYQLDCIAETANTTTYLMLLEDRDLLQFHRVYHPQHRAALLILFPHNSATIQEIESNNVFVVDSWFFENGKEPIILELSKWKDGYSPDPLTRH